jgi:hypothetical protein
MTASFVLIAGRHWALTDSRPCANMRRLIRRLAHLSSSTYKEEYASPPHSRRPCRTAFLSILPGDETEAVPLNPLLTTPFHFFYIQLFSSRNGAQYPGWLWPGSPSTFC